MTSPARNARSGRRGLLFLGVCALVGGGALAGRTLFATESVAERAARLGREHGLTVGYGDPSTYWVAPFTARDAQLPAVEMEAPDPTSVPPALDGIEESLNLYPAGFVARVARAIFVCGTLKVEGAAAGGTFGPAWIIVSAPRSIDDPSIRLTALLGVHHELSSLVLARDPSALRRWTALTPDARFVDGAPASLAQATAVDPDPATGFLSAYGATTAENDFNVYAEKMFTEPATLAKLAAAHPLVAKKTAFVAAAYAAVDPKIGDTFARLGLGAFTSAR